MFNEWLGICLVQAAGLLSQAARGQGWARRWRDQGPASSLKAAKKQGYVWNVIVKNRNQFCRERVYKDNHSLIGSQIGGNFRGHQASGWHCLGVARGLAGRELLDSWAAEGFTQDWRASSSWHAWWPPWSPHRLLTMPQRACKMPASSDSHCSFY